MRREGDAIDLVITDIVMPRMGGLVLQQRLKASAPAVPVLLMSGYSVEQLRAEVKDGPIDVLDKPWETHDLLQNIRRLLSGSVAPAQGTTTVPDPNHASVPLSPPVAAHATARS